MLVNMGPEPKSVREVWIWDNVSECGPWAKVWVWDNVSEYGPWA